MCLVYQQMPSPLFFIFVGLMYLVRRIQGKKVWDGTLKNATA